MQRHGASITTLHWTSLLSRWPAAASTMPAKTATKSWLAMQLKSGRIHSGNVRAILCGACGYELTIQEYMDSGYLCPHCGAGFNPGCRNHYDFYFALKPRLESAR